MPRRKDTDAEDSAPTSEELQVKGLETRLINLNREQGRMAIREIRRDAKTCYDRTLRLQEAIVELELGNKIYARLDETCTPEDRQELREFTRQVWTDAVARANERDRANGIKLTRPDVRQPKRRTAAVSSGFDPDAEIAGPSLGCVESAPVSTGYGHPMTEKEKSDDIPF